MTHGLCLLNWAIPLPCSGETMANENQPKCMNTKYIAGPTLITHASQSVNLKMMN